MDKDRIITKLADGTRDVKRDLAIARKCPLFECKTDADCRGNCKTEEDTGVECKGKKVDVLMNLLESSNPKRG